MKSYTTEKIRNVGLFSHGGVGKTTLTEAILFLTGTTDRQGRVEEGNTVSDYDPDELKRQMSIQSSLAPFEWQGHKINLIDTPGFIDFVGEVLGAMRVVDGAVILLSAQAGVEVGTHKVWELAEEHSLPTCLFVNRTDKEHADFFKTLDQAKESLSQKVVPLQIPIGSAEHFTGVVDLISKKGYILEKNQKKEVEIPQDLKEKVAQYREKLVELVAEGDDDLLTKYLDGQELSEEELRAGLTRGILKRSIFPLLCGSASHGIGVHLLLEFLIHFFPSPLERGEVKGTDPKSKNPVTRKPSPQEPFSALVFKTSTDPYVGKITYFRVLSGTLKADSVVLNPGKGKEEKISGIFLMRGKNQENVGEVVAGDLASVAKLQVTSTADTLCAKDAPIICDPIPFPEPVFTAAVVPKTKGDEDKLSVGLSRMMEEDPTFKYRRDNEIRQTLISGLGELHLDINMERLKRKFGVQVDLEPPKVPYKETIKAKIQVEGKYKRQSGGRGQYGHCWLELEPLERGKIFEFVDKVVGGVVPKNYIPAVEKGVREAMEEGVVAGYPLVDLRAKIYDGSYHNVDSSDMAFKIAGSMALRKGAAEASPVLLEPIASVEIIVPEGNMGDVMGDLNSKRGKILGMEPAGKGKQMVRALVPAAEMQRYAIDLRSMTQGRGFFRISFSHYEEVPPHVAEGIIQRARKDKEEVAT